MEPVLIDVDGTPAVQPDANVDLSTHRIALLSVLNAEIMVITGAAVSLQALREMGAEQYSVFVVGAGGELELRIVEVGLKD